MTLEAASCKWDSKRQTNEDDERGKAMKRRKAAAWRLKVKRMRKLGQSHAGDDGRLNDGYLLPLVGGGADKRHGEREAGKLEAVGRCNRPSLLRQRARAANNATGRCSETIWTTREG